MNAQLHEPARAMFATHGAYILAGARCYLNMGAGTIDERMNEGALPEPARALMSKHGRTIKRRAHE